MRAGVDRVCKVENSGCKLKVRAGGLGRRCQALLTAKASPQRISAQECFICREERTSKARVVDGRMTGSRDFANAKAILATNAVKYHVNKLRAQAWATEHGQALQYAIAKDKISSVALREKPDLGQDKLSWLQRHDQDCGALYGVLPLCVGMPITATDHLDRGRGILRGCAGVVVGWVWPSETGERTRKENNCVWNQLPACILVRFKTKESWRIDGLPEDNVFPVAPQKKPWYLDKGKRRPMLRVTRKQFPLAPGFATTAHAAQGQTCSEGVLMDMHIGEAGDPLAAYTALTRVKDRQGLFVYRPFAAAPFQKGAKIGRELLLRLWGGEQMDWSYLRAKYRGERQCWECREQKPVGAFTPGRWKRSDEARVCRECMQRHADALEPWQCMACKDWKEESAFAETLARPQCTFYRARRRNGAMGAPRGKQKTNFPEQCGRESARASGTVHVARRNPMACGHAAVAVPKNEGQSFRFARFILTSHVSRTENNSVLTVGGHRRVTQLRPRPRRGWRRGGRN